MKEVVDSHRGGEIYSHRVDLTNPHDVHALAIAAVPIGARVLDVGCADGSLSQHLAERGALVVGMDYSTEALTHARNVLSSVYQIDLEHDLEHQLAALMVGQMGVKFDCILAMDVLEHVRNPHAVLSALVHHCLADHGRLILSLPNVAHGSVRLALLEGRFEYSPTGLLDETHLRFFTKSSVDKLLTDCGLTSIIDISVGRDITATEVTFDSSAIASPLLKEVRADPQSYVYQFFRVAVRTDSSAIGRLELYNLVRSSNEVADEQQRLDHTTQLEKLIADNQALLEAQEHRLEAQEHRLEEVLAKTRTMEVAQRNLEDQLVLVHRSMTWRVGRLVTTPIRLIKRPH